MKDECPTGIASRNCECRNLPCSASFGRLGRRVFHFESHRQSNVDEHRSADCADFVAERRPGTFPCRTTSHCATSRDNFWWLCSLICLALETVVKRMDSEVRGSPQ